MKHLNNERGITLVELLAALVVTAVLGIVAYNILFTGFTTYDRVKAEAEMRDEADIIMVKLISDMFTLKTSEIKVTHLPENNTNNYYIELDNGDKVGFYDGDVYFKDQTTHGLQNGVITLGAASKITEVEKGQFHIYLTLEHANSNETLNTESEIGMILNTQ